MRNPYHRPPGSLPTAAVLDALAARVRAELRAKANLPVVADPVLRALHPLLADDNVWAVVVRLVNP